MGYIKKNGMDALEVSMYIIKYADKKGKALTNIKLQKILYYIQVNFLVQKGQPCIKDKFMRWEYGPVIESVYYEFRRYGKNEIPKTHKSYSVKYNIMKFEKVEIQEEKDLIYKYENLINKVIDKYIDMDAFQLVKKTHDEDPWKITDENKEISHHEIRKYYLKNKSKM
ncbi:MAG: Panacea domain-containing protein [Clostridium sp.]|uniref:Panacea domain-containing protein n=1 Tax=Clostridia TaxID=186801 RepID=UPI003F307C5A